MWLKNGSTAWLVICAGFTRRNLCLSLLDASLWPAMWLVARLAREPSILATAVASRIMTTRTSRSIQGMALWEIPEGYIFSGYCH